ncbi:uncharacterized protein LOC143217180 isoform X2 [Lasioglossum baleicum]|uniref:uncharacterized protein LOC143217180 isoform X2 n=1 Tax=Lasioglossum baleicum TaxID=434251 RepID=UPI003FCDE979
MSSRAQSVENPFIRPFLQMRYLGLATDLPKMAATYAGPLWEAGYRFTPNSRLLLKGIEWMKIPLASWPPWRLLLRLRPQGPRLLDILDPGALCLYYCGISKKII